MTRRRKRITGKKRWKTTTEEAVKRKNGLWCFEYRKCLDKIAQFGYLKKQYMAKLLQWLDA